METQGLIVVGIIVVAVIFIVIAYLCRFFCDQCCRFSSPSYSAAHTDYSDGYVTQDSYRRPRPWQAGARSSRQVTSIYSNVNERQPLPGQATRLLTVAEIDLRLKELQERTAAIENEGTGKEEGAKIVREVQTLLLAKNVQPTENTLHCKILIGVDATPAGLGGYCINLTDLSLQFYRIKMADFPWPMENQENPNPDEFEMKNLLFAMALWGNLIRRYEAFRIYTDNSAVSKKGNKFGLDATAFIDHFTECEGARKENKLEHLNRKLGKLEQFAVYIQPADDFSRWEIENGIDFLCKYYGIHRNNVQGTHTLWRRQAWDSKVRYNQNDNYRQYIQRAKAFASNFKSGTNCNCNINTFTNEPTRGPPAATAARERTRSRSRSQPRRDGAQGRDRRSRSEPRHSKR